MPQYLIVSFIIFMAVFVQSLSGFGMPLVAMALIPAIIGIHIATPLVAMVMASIEVFLLIHYWHAINIRAVVPIVLASIIGIPFGIWLSNRLDEGLVMAILGFVISAFALYALLNIRLPQLNHPAWAYLFGLMGGVLGGAYNTSGPPVIIYGNCRRWPPAEFKGNMQGFYILTSFMVAIGHIWNGNLTPEVWQYYLWSIPAMALAIFAGTRLDKYLNPESFRKVVLLLLLGLGVNLIRVI